MGGVPDHAPHANGLADIATVLGAVGGGAVTALFPAGSAAFNTYGIGLAIGFFLYLIVATVIASRTEGFSAVNEWLGSGPGEVPAKSPMPRLP